MRATIRTLGWTYRRRSRRGWDALDELTARSPTILACWHEQALLALEPVLRLVRAGLGVTLMVSHSRDGELATRVIRPWGVRVIRGSASRGGQAGLRGLYREIVRHDASPLVLPDGPRGPRGEVKPGAVVLSQTSRAPIQPLGFAASSSWRLRSWDRLAVARPFAEIAVAVGEPRLIERELDDSRRQQACRWLEEELDRLTARAHEQLRLSSAERTLSV